MRLKYRRLYFFLCCLLTVILIASLNFLKTSLFRLLDDDMYDLEFSTQNSSSNQSACYMPKLLVDDPSLSDFMATYDPLICSSMKNWVYTDDGKFYIDKEADKKHGPLVCNYYHIKRKSEVKYDEILYPDFKNGSSVIGDGFRVICKGRSNAYINVHFTVPDLKESGKLSPKRSDTPLSNMHVFFYLLDSVSRINFIRKLPKFYKFLTEDMNALDMQSFNIVGDGTPWAIVPLTTGRFEYELPEARKRFKNSSFLDNWPLIFRDFKKAGYGSVFAEEQAAYSAYAFRLKGFDKEPVDHYLRPVVLVADKDRPYHKEYCLGDTPKSLVWLKYWKELKKMYEKYNRRTFSTLFSSETSHDDYNLVQTLDEHWMNGFKKLWKENLLNNTLLVIMADHGRRFGQVRQSQTGKVEEKLPFLAMIPPPWFKNAFPNSYSNMLKNRNRLLTVFDLHATLKHFLNFSDTVGVGNLNERGISLFKEIPKQRTCQDASIRPHFCACLEWKEIKNPSNNKRVQKAVTLVINEINNLLKDAQGQCARVMLKAIIFAQMFKPNNDVLAFEKTSDYDNYFPKLDADKQLTWIYYQIRFTTSPGDADWEFTVTYFVESKEFKFVKNNLSRLNMYGKQPYCIINTQPHLSPYCYCLNVTKT